MNNYPTYVKVNGEKYDINTDFRVALECDRISKDETIGDYERCLAIIYKLFGDKGLEAYEIHDKLLELGMKYLACGKELEKQTEEPDMDFEQDMPFIEASFMSDYHIWLPDIKMHWWKFFNLINGLSNSDMGNCCVLNRVRNLRTYDVSQIKDRKERDKVIKAKKQVALKKVTKRTASKDIKDEAVKIYEKLGLRKE